MAMPATSSVSLTGHLDRDPGSSSGLGLAAAMGSPWLASHGGGKRERLEALRAVVEALEKRVTPGHRVAGEPMGHLGYRPQRP